MNYLWRVGQFAYATGSRVICDPPVLDTDEDYVVLTKFGTLKTLLEDGYVRTSAEHDYDITGFVAFRKGNVNLIATDKADFYHSFVNATRLAKALNLRDKKHRIALFQAVLYGRFPQ
jgi:hypothetical protein